MGVLKEYWKKKLESGGSPTAYSIQLLPFYFNIYLKNYSKLKVQG
jgi:hypothetical protein